MRSWLFLLLLMSFIAPAGRAAEAAAMANLPQRILDATVESREAWRVAAHLTDRIGPRLSGSPQAEEAVRWTAETLRGWGLEVRLQKVMVPHWVRGAEEARMVSPASQQLYVTALGGSVSTPADGITAEVLEVRSYEELKAAGDAARGKIVVYYNPMNYQLVEEGKAFQAYSGAVAFRSTGAVEAAKAGAVATLIRSVASHSLRTPHTGALRYDPAVPAIPAGAISTEDSELIHRLVAQGEKVTVRLRLLSEMLPDVESANVIAEIRGREKPEEIVVIGGHLDSWDLGTGAIDNASGVAMTMETMRVLHRLGVQPRRTIRAVLFMNEENGLRGGRAYATEHPAESHFAAVESDAGVGKPLGFFTTLDAAGIARFLPRLGVLSAIGANVLETSSSTGADTSPLVRAGVPGFGIHPDPRLYFAYHHSPADTLDKIDPVELQQNAAAMAVLTWVLAEMEEPLTIDH